MRGGNAPPEVKEEAKQIINYMEQAFQWTKNKCNEVLKWAQTEEGLRYIDLGIDIACIIFPGTLPLKLISLGVKGVRLYKTGKTV